MQLEFVLHGQKLVRLLRVEAVRVHQLAEVFPQLLLERLDFVGQLSLSLRNAS